MGGKIVEEGKAGTISSDAIVARRCDPDAIANVFAEFGIFNIRVLFNVLNRHHGAMVPELAKALASANAAPMSFLLLLLNYVDDNFTHGKMYT
ncbi:hypothetical protein M885DRAFT_573092 [Pelagophyceae sp. CCMP2097]|nr:hypothetical protein M885DRAFT_573092 [Pelagophyceae sp. CCMP2097]